MRFDVGVAGAGRIAGAADVLVWADQVTTDGAAARSHADASVIVPAEAVQAESKTAGVVFVVAGDHAQRRTVTLGPDVPGTPAGGRLVLDGVRAGERVVLSPPEGLGDGDAVKLSDKP